MINLKSMTKKLTEIMETKLRCLPYIKENGLLFKVKLSKDSITIVEQDKNKKKNKEKSIFLSVTAEVKEDTLYLFPPVHGKSTLLNRDFKKMCMVILLSGFNVYATTNNIKVIRAGKYSSSSLESNISDMYYHWTPALVDVLLSSGFKVPPQHVAVTKKIWDEYDKEKQGLISDAENMNFNFSEHVFEIDPRDIVYALPQVLFLEKYAKERARKKPVEGVYFSFYTDSYPCNIFIRNAHDQTTKISLVYEDFLTWYWVIDSEKRKVNFPLDKDIEKLISEFYEQNKMSYLMNPPVDALHTLFNKSFSADELFTFAVEAINYGINCIELENEAYLYTSKKYGQWEKPSIKLVKMSDYTFVIQLRETFLALSKEFNEELSIKITTDKGELLEFLNSLTKKRLEIGLVESN